MPESTTHRFVFEGGAPHTLHVHLPSGADTEAVLAAIEALSVTTSLIGADMAVDLSSLTASVERIDNVTDSARTLIEQIAAQVREVTARLDAEGVDTAALADLASKLESSASELSDAVVANTPAAET